MAKPRLDLLSIDPLESGALVYAPMAAPAMGRFEFGRLVLTFWMHNVEPAPLQLQSLRVAIVGPDREYEEKFPLAVTLAAGGSSPWSPAAPTDDVWFPLVPASKEARLEFRAAGFSEPKTFTFPLRPHRSPPAGGAYLFPARVGGLDPGEYWAGEGDKHPVGGAGAPQAFAYDLGVCDRAGGWLRPPGDGKRNEDLRVWGKGVHAMADGEVKHVLNELPDNHAPLPGNDFEKEMAAQKATGWGKWFEENGFDPDRDEVHGGLGNHLCLQHGDEIVQYGHLFKGSIPDRLLTVGATVDAGEFLGRAGNSGNSSGPHLHVQAAQTSEPGRGSLRPLLFSPISVLERDLVQAAPAPWVSVVEGRSLPPGKHCIWPSVPPPIQHLPEDRLIDPLALLLPNDLYVKLKLPRPPEPEVLLGILEPMLLQASPAERHEALARLHLATDALAAVAKAIESSGLLAPGDDANPPTPQIIDAMPEEGLEPPTRGS